MRIEWYEDGSPRCGDAFVFLDTQAHKITGITALRRMPELTQQFFEAVCVAVDEYLDMEQGTYQAPEGFPEGKRVLVYVMEYVKKNELLDELVAINQTVYVAPGVPHRREVYA